MESQTRRVERRRGPTFERGASSRRDARLEWNAKRGNATQ
jgi:hypothetical protein